MYTCIPDPAPAAPDQNRNSNRTSETQWARLLQGHAAMRNVLGAHVQTGHGLTVNQYAALLLLAQADEQRLRRTHLADGLRLSRSGLSRVLDGLQDLGLVEQREAPSDARRRDPVLTETGLARIARPRRPEAARLPSVFGERYSDDEITTLVDLLGRLAVMR